MLHSRPYKQALPGLRFYTLCLSVSLSAGQVLGSGAFGRVVEATVSGLRSHPTTKVAIKMVKCKYLSLSVCL